MIMTSEERQARDLAMQAAVMRVVIGDIARTLSIQFSVGMMPTVFGLLDAATLLAKIMLTEAEKHEGAAGVGGTRELLAEKIRAMQQVLEYQADHASDARTSSRN